MTRIREEDWKPPKACMTAYSLESLQHTSTESLRKPVWRPTHWSHYKALKASEILCDSRLTRVITRHCKPPKACVTADSLESLQYTGTESLRKPVWLSACTENVNIKLNWTDWWMSSSVELCHDDICRARSDNARHSYTHTHTHRQTDNSSTSLSHYTMPLLDFSSDTHRRP